ncbi:toxin-antitoxin system HicB family antitoxin [Rhizobium sp. BR 362]|uniref:toxin-antitoxin system HicB family antitoxin n=1 Tax=Rhizobium sp. BR 362 TaxID=3040670 RepID=UPI002F423F30
MKALAVARGTSLNKLFEELSTKALTEFNAETRFRLRVASGDRARGLEILEKLDRVHSEFGSD